MTVPAASSMAPCRVALGAPSPSQRCMDASIWSSSPNLSLLGRDGCLAFSFLALCLLGDLIPADLSILYIAPYDIPIPSSSRSFSVIAAVISAVPPDTAVSGMASLGTIPYFFTRFTNISH